jgi:hypothetical protein
VTPRTQRLTFDHVVQLAQRLPGVELSTSYGTPALKVNGKLVARLWEDETTLVLRATSVVRDHLIATSPEKFFLTDHYKDYPWVLVRLAVVTAQELQPLLEDAWRQVAPKRSIAALDETI